MHSETLGAGYVVLSVYGRNIKIVDIQLAEQIVQQDIDLSLEKKARAEQYYNVFDP